MQATVERNKDTGEFSCVVGGKVMLSGSTGSKIKRVHDMADAINRGGEPRLISTGVGESRVFHVLVGDFEVSQVSGPIKAYRELDKLAEAFYPSPAVPVVEMGGVHAGSAPHEQ